MYKNFFGLSENPFNINPDPRFLYLTPQTQEALDQLTYGIQNRKGCILLTGEVGTGKTTLVNYLLDWLRHKRMPTAFIFNSHLRVNHLFDFILTEFGIPVDFRLKSNMLLQLTKWLLERFRAGETPVLILDEAQGLSLELLEEVRLLLNLETASEKLLQIVLVGQPELEDKLKRPELRQFRQRIALRCTTAPLTLEESYGYIAERLRIVGAKGDPIFAPEAMEAVHFYSRGIPRVMNLLCEHALINAYVEQLNPVRAQMVEEAARNFLWEEFRPFPMHSSSGNNTTRDLTVIQSISAKQSVRPFRTEESSLHEPSHATRPTTLATFAVEEHALTAEKSSVTTVPERGESAASRENQNLSAFLNDLIPSLPRLEQKQNEKGLSSDSFPWPPYSAAQLVAELKRLLVTVSPIASLLIPPRGGKQPSPAASDTKMSVSESHALTLSTINQLLRNSRRTSIRVLVHSWKSWRRHRTTRFLLATALAAWPRVAAVVVRRVRQPIYPVWVMQRWILEFKRDWISMMNAFGFPQMNKSLRRWLRQPVPFKPMTSRKNQPV
jgi:general secretion pathway protein A